MSSNGMRLLLSLVCIGALAKGFGEGEVASTPPTLQPVSPVCLADLCSKKPPLFDPVVWGCNDEWKLQFSGDTRLRYEYWDNMDYNDDTDADEGSVVFWRTRLNFDLTYSDCVRMFVQLFDARQWGADEYPAFEDHTDIQQAFLELKNPKCSPWSARIGRQELAFGDQLIIGAQQWRNLIPTFDGVRVTHSTPDADIDLFAVQPVNHYYFREGTLRSGHGWGVDDQFLYGAYSSFKIWKPQTVEFYAFGFSDDDTERDFPVSGVSEDGKRGKTNRYVLGSRLTGPLWSEPGCGQLIYGVEGALQLGERSNDDIRAHILHAYLVRMFEHPMKPMIGIEGILMSGDDKYGDGETNTWDPLYASGDVPLGIWDWMVPMNVRDISLRAGFEPTSKLKVLAEFHQMWLDSESDAWVDGWGRLMGVDPTGKSGRTVGTGIDLILNYKVSECMSIDGGAGHFFPGTFAENVGRDDGGNIFFLQTVFKF